MVSWRRAQDRNARPLVRSVETAMAPGAKTIRKPAPRTASITASHTLRMSDQKSGGSGAYQRYPVLAPTRVSVIDVDIDRDRGDASARSHVRETRPSESANA